MGQMWRGRRVLLLAACATASALTAASMRAEEQTAGSVASSTKPRSYAVANAAAERIEAVLDQKLRAPLSEVEAPLNQVLMVIADDYDIPIVFDAAALDAVAASPEVEVSIEINNVSLRSALELILKNAGEDLTYIIDKEVLLITTQEEAEKRLEVRVYVVGDLVREGSSLVWNEDGDFDPLINAIVSTVERESWMENGTGEGEIQPLPPGMLVVAQTRRVHEQIADLLGQIREAKHEVNANRGEHPAELANSPVLRSIPFYDETIADSEETRNMLYEIIKKSVDWDRPAEGNNGGDLVLHVLPNRVLVRHVPEVIEQVNRVVRHVIPSAKAPVVMGSSGRMGGGGRGAASSSGASPTPAAVSPELAEPPAGGENGERRQPSGFGGF